METPKSTQEYQVNTIEALSVAIEEITHSNLSAEQIKALLPESYQGEITIKLQTNFGSSEPIIPPALRYQINFFPKISGKIITIPETTFYLETAEGQKWHLYPAAMHSNDNFYPTNKATLSRFFAQWGQKMQEGRNEAIKYGENISVLFKDQLKPEDLIHLEFLNHDPLTLTVVPYPYANPELNKNKLYLSVQTKNGETKVPCPWRIGLDTLLDLLPIIFDSLKSITVNQK